MIVLGRVLGSTSKTVLGQVASASPIVLGRLSRDSDGYGGGGYGSLPPLVINKTLLSGSWFNFYSEVLTAGAGRYYRAHGVISVSGCSEENTAMLLMSITDGSGYPGYGWFQQERPAGYGKITASPAAVFFDSGPLLFNGTNSTNIYLNTQGWGTPITFTGTIYFDLA